MSSSPCLHSNSFLKLVQMAFSFGQVKIKININIKINKRPSQESGRTEKQLLFDTHEGVTHREYCLIRQRSSETQFTLLHIPSPPLSLHLFPTVTPLPPTHPQSHRGVNFQCLCLIAPPHSRTGVFLGETLSAASFVCGDVRAERR